MYTSKDLADMGYQPGPWFPEFVKAVNRSKINTLEEINSIFNTEKERFQKIKMKDKFEAWDLFEYCPFHLAMDQYDLRNFESVREYLSQQMRLPRVSSAAILPNAYFIEKGQHPEGVVIRTKEAIFPGFLSDDLASLTSVTVFHSTANLERIVNAVRELVTFRRVSPDNPWSCPSFVNKLFQNNPLLHQKSWIESAGDAFGTLQGDLPRVTVGLEVEPNDTKRIYVTIRGGVGNIGARLRRAALKMARRQTAKVADKEVVETNPWIDANSPEARHFVLALHALKQWSYANHRALHQDIIDHSFAHNQVFEQTTQENGSLYRVKKTIYHTKGVSPALTRWLPYNDDFGYYFAMDGVKNDLRVRINKNQYPLSSLGFMPAELGRFSNSTELNQMFEGVEPEDHFEFEKVPHSEREFDASYLSYAFNRAEAIQDYMENAHQWYEVLNEIEPVFVYTRGK